MMRHFQNKIQKKRGEAWAGAGILALLVTLCALCYLAPARDWACLTSAMARAEIEIDSLCVTAEAELSESEARDAVSRLQHLGARARLSSSRGTVVLRVSVRVAPDAALALRWERALRRALPPSARVTRLAQGYAQEDINATCARMLYALSEGPTNASYENARSASAEARGAQVAARQVESGTECLMAAPSIPFDY